MNLPEEGGDAGGENDDVEMQDAEVLLVINNQNGNNGADENNSNDGRGDGMSGDNSRPGSDGDEGEQRPTDEQVYVNWAEQAAAARNPIDEPLPEHLIQVMAKVFNNDMLVENILDKVIDENDRSVIRSCRLVSKTWLISLAKLYRKKKKPQFLVNTNKENPVMNELRVRPMFEQHTLLYEFIRPMTTNIRHEGFIPTFSLTLGPSYFRKSNYTDFVNCLVQCGSSLVELYVNFPKNSGMSFLLPPEISLPNLTTLGVSFSAQSLLGHHFPVAYHHQHGYYPNYCSVHLVQNILNASKSLRNFYLLPCTSQMNPPDLENLYLPDTLQCVHVDTPLRDFELFLKRPLPYLTEIRINATIVQYAEENIHELLSKLGPTLRTIWLNGHPATRRSLPIRLPRLEHVTKFYMFKPWEFEEREPSINFEEVFPKLETLVFANQTQYSLNVLMKGMRSTTVTSFCVCLTSNRPTQGGFMVQLEDVGPANPFPAHLREDDRFRREMQMRLERMREIAVRGRAAARRADEQNAAQHNQAVPPPIPVRARLLERERIRERGEQARLRAERALENQMRQRMEMQQHLAHYRALRDRYERFARMNRYRDEAPPQPPPPFVAHINRNNGNDPPVQRVRPVLEVRQVLAPPNFPPPPAHAPDQRVAVENAYRLDHAYAMARRNRVVGDGEPGRGPLPEIRVLQGPPRAHHNPPFAQPNVIRIPMEPVLNAPIIPIVPPNGQAELPNQAMEEDDGGDVILIEENNPPGNQNANPVNLPPPRIVEPVAGPSREATGAAAVIPPEDRQDADGRVPVNREVDDRNNVNNEEIQVIREIPPLNQRNNNNDNANGNPNRRPIDDGVIEFIYPDPGFRLRDLRDLVEISSDSDDDDPWNPHVVRVPLRGQRLIDLVVPQAFGNGNNNNNNININNNNEAQGPAAGPANAPPPPLPPRAHANGGPPNGNAAAQQPRPNVNPVEQGEGQRGNNDIREQIRERARAAMADRRERFVHRGRGERPGQPIRRRAGDHHLIELWDIRNPMPPALPERPITMTKDKMQSINLAFPNLSKLTIQVCGPETCGLRYIFEEMRSLQVLKIVVESSLWNIKWDSLLTGIPDDFCEAVKTNSEIWDDVYLNENPASIRNMAKLEELMLMETVKVDEREPIPQGSSEERQISDVAFQFGFTKLKSLKRLTVTQGFSPSQGMFNRWYDEKGYKIKVKPRTRLDMSFYADQ